MNDNAGEPEPEPRSGPEPMPESEDVTGDIILLCHPHNVETLVRSLEEEIADARGSIPVSVLWSGTSRVLHQGVIILTWHEMIPTAFLQSLARDHEIFDLVAYSYEVSGNEQQEAAEQAEPSSASLPG